MISRFHDFMAKIHDIMEGGKFRWGGGRGGKRNLLISAIGGCKQSRFANTVV